ncbi:MAG: ABC transporter permease [Oscillospiraceae bacterium]|nr:ABC transporter permease [Oscillospiraceae bacterium]
MQVLNVFFKVLKKKFPSALAYIIVFFSIAIAMANMGGTTESFEDTRVTLSVIDRDKTETSKAFVDYISKNNKVVSIEDDERAITDSIYNEVVSYVVVINEGYESKISTGETEGLFSNYKSPKSSKGVFIDGKIDLYTKTLSAYILNGNTTDEAVKKTSETLGDEVEVKLESFKKDKSSEFSESFAFYFQYLPYGILSVLITALSPVLLTLNKKEIKDRTNCSCIKFSSQTAQMILGSFIFAIVLWAVFAFAGVMMNDGALSERHLLAVLNSFVFALISLAIALIVSNLAKTQESVGMLANIVGLGMSFLCGVFVPQSLLGEGVLNVARILPAYWYVRANDMLAGINNDVYSIGNFMKFLGIEIAFAVVLFVVAIVISRMKKRAY